MGNCKNCRYWEKHIDIYNKKWSECNKAYWIDKNDRIEENSFGVYTEAADDSGLSCGLKTGPLFGCIQFKER